MRSMGSRKIATACLNADGKESEERMKNPAEEETQDGRKYLARWERDRLGAERRELVQHRWACASVLGKLEELHSVAYVFFQEA